MKAILKEATDAAMAAGHHKAGKAQLQRATQSDIRLLLAHQDLGQMNDVDLARSEATISDLIHGNRRFNKERGFQSYAELRL